MTENKSEAAAFARGQGQPPRRGEIGNRPVIRQFSDHTRQCAALERFLHRPQGIARTGDLEEQELPCRQTKKITAKAIDVAALDGGEIRLDPKRVATVIAGARSHRKCKAHGRTEVTHYGRGNFMQTGRGKTALQHGIDSPDAERERPRADTEIGFLPFDFRHGLPETAQGGWRSSGHHTTIVHDLF